MTAADMPHDTPAEPDRADPGTGDVCPEAGEDAVRASIRDWAEKLKEVEAVRARELAARESAEALIDLSQLRGYVMGMAERLDRQGRGLLTVAEENGMGRARDPVLSMVKTARAVRQIVVLQMEMLGQRPVAGARAETMRPHPPGSADRAPPSPTVVGERPSGGRDERTENDLDDLRERSDLDDLYDYDDRPRDQVVFEMRKTLRIPAGLETGVTAAVPPAHRHGLRRTLTASAAPAGLDVRERGPP